MLDRIIRDYNRFRKREYFFYLENGTIINLRFKKTNLPHLIGIGKLKDDNDLIKKFDSNQISAKKILKELKENGFTYTVLKSYPSWTGHLTRRMQNFTYENINLLLKRSTVCEFIYDPGETDNDKAKFVFVDQLTNFYIHLFVGHDQSKDYYYPNSFTCEFDKHRQCGDNKKIKISRVVIEDGNVVQEINHDEIKGKIRDLKKGMKDIHRITDKIAQEKKNDVKSSKLVEYYGTLDLMLKEVNELFDFIGAYIPLPDFFRIRNNAKLEKFHKKIQDGYFYRQVEYENTENVV